MLSMEQKITMGDIKRLEEMANSLLEIAQMAKTDLGDALADDDADLYLQHSIDIIDETSTIINDLNDWVEAAE